MKETKLSAGSAASAILLTLIFAVSANADWRHEYGTENDDGRGYVAGREAYRDNDRVTMEGRITSIGRERDGYRVRLDRGG